MSIDELVQKKLQLVFEDDSIIFDKSRFAGGLTNYNYIMDIHGTEYVIRKPGGKTNLMIDRGIEKVNNAIACDLGLNTACYYFDEISGIKISIYLKNSRNFAQTDPASPQNLKAVSEILKKTHGSPKPFSNTFDWKVELNKYEDIVRELKGEFFFDYAASKKQLFEDFNKNVTSLVSVPCHNDTVPENFIADDTGKTYLIDWEYAGKNDPSWDIAAYILESRLDEEAIHRLILDYYGEWPSPAEILKIKYFMIAQDLLWTVWSLVRHYNGEDFLEYCFIRYERFRRNLKAMADSEEYSLSDMVKQDLII